jgi:HEAT repeat protein
MSDDISKLIEQAKDNTVIIGVRKRRAAVQKLGELGTPDTVLTLVESLDDEDNEVQRNAFLGLSNLSNPQSHEVLRNVYLKTKKMALWQIIRNKQMFPSSMEKKIEFYSKIELIDQIVELVNEENFSKILEIIITSKEIMNPAKIIIAMLDKVKTVTEIDIVKKFVNTKNDILFSVIDTKNWYPADLSKKLIFLLMTGRHNKIMAMLESDKFKEIIDIIMAEDFRMKKQAFECLSEVQDPTTIDRLCNLYLQSRHQHLGQIIYKNNWAPQDPRERILFYMKTSFLNAFFNNQKVDPLLMGGYFDIIHVREQLKTTDYEMLSDFLHIVAKALSSGETPDLSDENPLIVKWNEVQEYLAHPKEQIILDDIIFDYLQHRSKLLEYLLVKQGWTPEKIEEKIEFYFNSNQEKQILKMGENSIDHLYKLMKGLKNKENLQEPAGNILKQFASPASIKKIFRIYFKEFDKQLEDIIRDNNWKPEDKESQAVFYIVSGQIEKYISLESGKHELLLNAYKNLDLAQKYKVLEVLLKYDIENFDNFLVELMIIERNPRIFKLLSNAIIKSFGKLEKIIKEKIPRMNESAIIEIIKILEEIKKDDNACKMLYNIARIKKGYICLWVLKILEEKRWVPSSEEEKTFFNELYKNRDEILRLLQNWLVDESPSVREYAAMTISRLGDERVIPLLMKYSEDPVPDVSCAISYAMGQLCALSPQKALYQIESFKIGSVYMVFNDVRKAFMVESEEQQTKIISRNFDIGTPILRMFSVSTLAGMKSPESVSLFLKALNCSEHLIKKTALKALVELATSECVQPIYSLLENGNQEIRMFAAQVMRAIPDEEIINRIEDKIEKSHFKHSDSLLTVMGEYNPDKYKEMLKKIVMRPDFDLAGKHAAIIALAENRDKETQHFIIEQWKSQRMFSDDQAAWQPYIKAFEKMGNHDALVQLSDVYSYGKWDVGKEAILAMASVPDRDALIAIVNALDNDNGWIQMAAVDALNEYCNNHLEIKYTLEELKFIGAIAAKLQNLNIVSVTDRFQQVSKILVNLNLKLLVRQLTDLYLDIKSKVPSAETVNIPELNALLKKPGSSGNNLENNSSTVLPAETSQKVDKSFTSSKDAVKHEINQHAKDKQLNTLFNNNALQKSLKPKEEPQTFQGTASFWDSMKEEASSEEGMDISPILGQTNLDLLSMSFDDEPEGDFK